MLVFSGESGSEIVARLKRDLLPTMINGIMYWPFCDFLTFKFIPVQLQVHSHTLVSFFLPYRTFTSSALNFHYCSVNRSLCFYLAAIGQQLILIFMDCVHDLHGKLGKSST